MPFAILGVFILFFGWFGFNPGSELAADTTVGYVALTTLLAGLAGGLAATLTVLALTKVADVGMAGNGVLAGLVSITAGCGTVEPWAAVIIGLIGGVGVVLAVLFIDRAGVDDPVGAVAVHGVGGVWGTLAIGLFARYDDAFLGRENAGLFYGGGFSQLAVQALLVVIVMAWVLGMSGLTFWLIKRTVGLRVEDSHEVAGLDVAEHGAPGYGPDSMFSVDLGRATTAVSTKQEEPA